jgi:alanyl-tRNA synthetase
MTSLNDIRTSFLDYFAKHGHEIVPSAPLVPRNDPTLLFTNAGMVPFKNVFTGAETRKIPRAASSQKCVRAGGKHNDLDNVGYTARHHTFFEMLGNFSFGDYFKPDAIEFAWRLLTKEFALPEKRLTITVFAEDDEAFGLWRKIAGLPEERIIRIGTSDNFWSMGDTGPCGPCSEIFFDHGEKIPGGPPGSAEADGDRFVEIWNLVFMQYEQEAGGVRRPLPKPSIDTGMGLERIAAVLQGVHDNYDTDLFRALIRASAEASGVPASGEKAVSHRVIADHLRASGFLVADGVLPANDGRGYVLRRIMRRAMRHAHLLGTAEPLLYRLVPALIREMGAAYPELSRAQSLITETLKLEETRFRQTLERGLKLLDEATSGLAKGAVLPGETAFKLYDTYGFPVDLTADALRPRGLGLDMAGFEAAMARQRAEARAAWAGSGEEATAGIWLDLAAKHGASEFLGYETGAAEGRIVEILQDGKPVAAIEAGAEADIIANQTPYYAESGGQVGDTGALFSSSGANFEVSDTLKRAGQLHVHHGTLTHGTLKAGDIVEMRIDEARRNQIRANHSATHLLHEALRRVLGPHVTQKGSLVAPERLRFDFSHPKALSAGEIAEVEREVNAAIRANIEVTTGLMTPEEAIKAGALALFGEKYGETVRVLSMGARDEVRGRPFSVELCGGTHVRRLGDIALLKIIGESAVSSGVRRIEALTGEAARLYLVEQERLAREAAAELKTTPSELKSRLVHLMEEKKRLERELSEAKRALALGGGAASAGDEVQTIGGYKVVARAVEVEAKELRGLIDEAKKKLGSGIAAFVGTAGGKASIAVGVTADLAGAVSAVDLVRLGSEALGGKGGGGRPDFAQAGGPDPAKADAALKAILSSLERQAGAA